jgi:Ca2+-binding EF-hand superfamily protein
MSNPRFAGPVATVVVAAALIVGPATAQNEPVGRTVHPPTASQMQNPYIQRFMELYDLDRDGKVSLQEILSDQSRLFGAIDIDSDKNLSIEEIRRRGRLLQMWRTTTLFDLLDTNGDGVLTISEINSPTQRWFKRYDVNHDGVLAPNEIPDRSQRWGNDQR